MKAVVCKAFGPPESLVIDELPAPKAGRGEVVVAVKAASVNFPDVLVIQNKYQVKPTLPFSPGSEMAGVVKSVGDGVNNVKPGDRVIAFSSYGAFAEECLVQAARLVPMPDAMDFATGAAFLLTYGTSHHALCNRAAPKAGETLLVLGAAGGVGIAAIEIGKVLGLRVIACASSPRPRSRRRIARFVSACRIRMSDRTNVTPFSSPSSTPATGPFERKLTTSRAKPRSL